MAQILIRGLDDDVKQRLQRRAKQHGRSTEAEVRDILRNAIQVSGPAVPPLGSRLARRFARTAVGVEIRELRGHRARPAELDP